MRLAAIAFLALALHAAVLISPVRAEIKEFPYFSIDLPPGWNVYDEGITVAFIAKNDSATLTVTVEFTSGKSTEGMTAEELAHAYAKEMKGTKPVMEDNDPNYYSFEFKAPGGIDSEASIVVSGHRFYLLTVTGRHEDMAGMVESVLISIQ